MVPKLPRDIIDIILDHLFEDRAKSPILKCLSLVNRHFASRAQKELFKQLRLPVPYPAKDVEEICHFLSSNPNMRAGPMSIRLTDLFRDVIAAGGDTNTDRISKQNVQKISQIFDALDLNRCTHLSLEHSDFNNHGMGTDSLIIPLITTTFLTLTHLTICRGPFVRLRAISIISTLECLELLEAALWVEYSNNGLESLDKRLIPLPRLKRLVIIERPRWNTVPYHAFQTALPGLFDLSRLESVAVQSDENSRLFIHHLVSLCSHTLTELLIYVKDSEEDFPYFCENWTMFSACSALKRLHLYFEEGIQPDRPDQELEFREANIPEFEWFNELQPPPLLEHLSLSFKCRSLPRDELDAWWDSQVPFLTSTIEDGYEDGWLSLKRIDFRLVFTDQVNASQLEFGDVRMDTLESKGIVVSTLPNEVFVGTNWPYYHYASRGYYERKAGENEDSY